MADPITFVIDISHHQDKSLNLAQTRRDGCELCLMKAGEGSSFVDPDFASNLVEARAAGQLVGAYWYQRGNVSAAAHVAKIKQVVPKDVPVILDVEHGSGGIALTREIIRLLNGDGYRTPLLYIPRWYWQQIGSPSLVGLPPLWSSRYPDNVVGTLADEWADVPPHYWNGYGGLGVLLLQFTSSARIAGYQPLDASAFRGTRAQLAAVLGGQTQEDDMPSVEDLIHAKVIPNKVYGDAPDSLGSLVAWTNAEAHWANAKLDALNSTVGQLVKAVANVGDLDEAALARELAPLAEATINATLERILADKDTVDEKAVAQAVFDEFRALLGRDQ
ncbi:glycoside hydrolase family 25 protein [Amycolatopsis roodepoortensis]|uniref:Lysozyme n=1 Tax=Amycolatopsis roodepoortensis TaxID=700274 RepID=A0ABR9L2V0_9PSEU|nr:MULTISPECIES: glycoside hydrolase family 25 protein [Amycolatopsis]MBE1575071.1 hypothetical protein [Amycolatopsis roodepoortensis]GHG97534.1 hypothetical protein GCM10017788_77110 [Amycolatopsis acidiphila]